MFSLRCLLRSCTIQPTVYLSCPTSSFLRTSQAAASGTDGRQTVACAFLRLMQYFRCVSLCVAVPAGSAALCYHHSLARPGRCLPLICRARKLHHRSVLALSELVQFRLRLSSEITTSPTQCLLTLPASASRSFSFSAVATLAAPAVAAGVGAAAVLVNSLDVYRANLQQQAAPE